MKRASILAVVLLLIAGSAHATDLQAVLGPLRNRIEASDYRATGQLVRVDANGNRVIYAVSVKGLWFAGALHMLVDVVPPQGMAAPARQDERMRILLEMRPSGSETIRVYRPNEAMPTLLPFDKWNEGVAGSGLSYEDLLDPQYFWPGQIILKTTVFDTHQCYVLKSTPGASDRTHYSEVQTWLDRAIDYPVYSEKVLKQSGTVKEFTDYGLRQSSGVWSATQVEVKIRGRAGSTFLIIKRGSAKAHLSVKDFESKQITHFEDRP